ncbi:MULTISPECIES: hypothetical protein [unclassified Aureimonas]|uniref:hypothetical protein n=1 Tax=unclassified Aureimonas TaxID=2615206 RepID=UPI0006F3A17D|nr:MULTISPECIES: hypothetical protein [unclassified Aureimonas]KQT66151.1 hypothetical protein ASG62_20335 [Aureimonas sp. Leaf427]KQT80984.1 hypothetical protein ASG54_05915 [Aureimonas sp. Leaf460]
MLTQTRKGLLDWINARPGARGRRRWHRATSATPVLLRDGSLSRPGEGQLWRREAESGWEYEQDDGFEEPGDDLD